MHHDYTISNTVHTIYNCMSVHMHTNAYTYVFIHTIHHGNHMYTALTVHKHPHCSSAWQYTSHTNPQEVRAPDCATEGTDPRTLGI